MKNKNLIKELPPHINLEDYKNKWIKIGLATGRANRARAVASIALAYQNAGLTAPKLEDIHWVDSPFAAVRLFNELAGNAKEKMPQFCYGFHSAGFLSYYNVFLGLVDGIERLNPLFELAEEIGWWIPMEGAVIVSERPKSLSLDGEGRMHNESGPAIEYFDGNAIYAIEGVVVPSFVVNDPHKISVDNISEEINAEVKRIMIERYVGGVSQYLKDSKAEVVHYDGGLAVEGGAPRVLLKDSGGLQWLVGTDGSTRRIYHMPVPSEAETCEQAHSMIAGFSENLIVSEA